MKSKNHSMLIGTLILSGCTLLTPANSANKEMVIDETMVTPTSGTTTNNVESDNNTPSDDKYRLYDSDNFAMTGKRRVLFFYAAWCPTCRPVDKELTSRESDIPDGVTVFRVNYDTEKQLIDRYDITYQHTFVLVDENDEEVVKWNGGGLQELITRLRSLK